MSIPQLSYKERSVFREDKTVFVGQSIKHPVSVKELQACRSWLNTVTVETNAQLTRCIVQSLIVGGDLNAHSCNLATGDVNGKAILYNCYQMDSITANDTLIYLVFASKNQKN